jgi:hypothetical protein
MTASTNPEGIAGVGKKMGESQLVPIYHKLEQAFLSPLSFLFLPSPPPDIQIY